MEDIKTLLGQSEDYLMSSSEESESNDEELSKGHGGDEPLVSFNFQMSVYANTSKKRNGEQRLPTRRPDPNVYNRNALLARENRRKKKMYLESIEKELQDARKANRTLLKALKRQSKVSRRLEQEKKYFQSLFANRSEILSLFSAINIFRLPYESAKSPSSSTTNSDYDKTSSRKVDPSTSSYSSSSQDLEPSSINFDNPSDGSVTLNNQSYSSVFSSFDFCTFPDFFTDFEDVNGSNLPPSTGWDDLWNNNGYHNNTLDDLPIPISSPPRKDVVYVDHSYVAASMPDSIQSSRQQNEFFSESLHSQSSLDFDVDTTTGNCLHIVGGNVSMDFCPTCHWNSNNRTPPLQLLNDEP